jgi:hypothetical protein
MQAFTIVLGLTSRVSGTQTRLLHLAFNEACVIDVCATALTDM